jgi:hypothetical protein
MHQAGAAPAGAAPAGAAPAGAAPAAAGPRVWSFECDRGTARRAVRRSDVFFSQTSRLPPAVSQPAEETRSRQFTRTRIHKCNSENINVPLADTPDGRRDRAKRQPDGRTRADIACAPRCRRCQRGERSLPSLAAVPRARRPSARRARLPRSHRMGRVARRRLAVGWSLKLTRY